MSLSDDMAANSSVPTSTQPASLSGQMAQDASQPVAKQDTQRQFNGTGSTWENFSAGIGSGMTRAVRAAKEGLDMGANYLEEKARGTTLGNAIDWSNKMLGFQSANQILQNTRAGIAEQKQMDAPLMMTRAGRIGGGVGTASVALPSVLIPGANTYTGAALIGAGTGAITTDGSLGDRAKGAAWGAAGGVAGKGLGDAIGWGASKLMDMRAASLAAQQAANQGRDAAAQTAMGAGYKLPPTEINPSITNQALEGLSGKVKTSQAASYSNQNVTNSLAKKALGVSEDTPLTPELLQSIRAKAGQAYEALKGTGTVSADTAYNTALDAIKAQYEGAAKSFPGLSKPEVTNLVDSLRQPSFDASSAVDAMRVLRETADAAFRSGNSGVGKAAKSASQAVEDLMERHLQQTGNESMLSAYQSARQTIAKSYDIGRALNPATGDINAQVLGSMAAKGRPLAGELKTIASTAQAFPKATQALKQNYNAVSPLDYLAGFAGGVHNPLLATAALARPTVRSLILSSPYQAIAARNLGDYSGGLLSNSVYPALSGRPLSDLLRVGGMSEGINAAQQQ